MDYALVLDRIHAAAVVAHHNLRSYYDCYNPVGMPDAVGVYVVDHAVVAAAVTVVHMTAEIVAHEVDAVVDFVGRMMGSPWVRRRMYESN